MLITRKEYDFMEKPVRHMVIFSLMHEKDSPEERKFLQDGQELLTSIPVVKDFQVHRQVSRKNDYDFGFSMVFDNCEDYETYNSHPVHRDFVAGRWEKEVTKFLEIDFQDF